jgi:hypothetical protein
MGHMHAVTVLPAVLPVAVSCLLLYCVGCRAAAGPCDKEEHCTGDNSVCPSDVYKHKGHVCKYVNPAVTSAA